MNNPEKIRIPRQEKESFGRWTLKEFLNSCTVDEITELLSTCVGRKQLTETVLKIYDSYNVITNTRIERFFWRKFKEKKGQFDSLDKSD